MADRRHQYSALTKLGIGALTFNSALAVYMSWGDAVAFVLAADAALALALLFLGLREFERADRGRDDMIGGIAGRYLALARMGLAAVACDAALAVHDARPGAAGSMAFVLLAYATLLALTWLFLRSFDDRARGARR